MGLQTPSGKKAWTQGGIRSRPLSVSPREQFWRAGAVGEVDPIISVSAGIIGGITAGSKNSRYVH